jgi:hypothetical protein
VGRVQPDPKKNFKKIFLKICNSSAYFLLTFA